MVGGFLSKQKVSKIVFWGKTGGFLSSKKEQYTASPHPNRPFQKPSKKYEFQYGICFNSLPLFAYHFLPTLFMIRLRDVQQISTTLLKFNSSPLIIGRAPKGISSSNQPLIFRGKLAVTFGEGINLQQSKLQISQKPSILCPPSGKLKNNTSV